MCVYVPNAHRHTRAQRHAAAVGGVEEGNSDAQNCRRHAASSSAQQRHHCMQGENKRIIRLIMPAQPGAPDPLCHAPCPAVRASIHIYLVNSTLSAIYVSSFQTFSFSLARVFFFLLPQVTLVGRLNKCLTDFLSSLTEKKNRIETRFTLVFFSHIKRQHIYFV